MEQKPSSYLNFARQGLRLARALPIRFSKYSNKTYDNHQKLVLLVLKQKFDGRCYHQRSKVETVFSVLKLKYGPVLRARSFAGQEVEAICKIVAYNADRMAALYLLLISGFQQSRLPFS